MAKHLFVSNIKGNINVEIKKYQYESNYQDIARIEIRGDSYEEMCPTAHCKIEIINVFFDPSKIGTIGRNYEIQFKIAEEQFVAVGINCMIDGILKNNKQETYYCHTNDSIYNSPGGISPGGKYWIYNTTGIYDAKNNILRITGNLTDESESGSLLGTDTTGNITDNSASLLNATSITTHENARTFNDCYTNFASTIFLMNMFKPASVDLTNPDLKQLGVNMCNYFHDKTGTWINILEDRSILEADDSGEFARKYYPQGPPASLVEAFKYFNQTNP